MSRETREHNCSEMLNCSKIVVKFKYEFILLALLLASSERIKSSLREREREMHLFKILNSRKYIKKTSRLYLFIFNSLSFNLLHFCLLDACLCYKIVHTFYDSMHYDVANSFY